MQGDAAGPRQKKKAMPLQEMLRKGLLQDGEVLRYKVNLKSCWISPGLPAQAEFADPNIV